MDLVIVTGQSGAGKSTSLNALADVGYYCVDNLPTSMVPELLTTLRGAGHLRVAVGIDARGEAHVERIVDILEDVRSRGDSSQLVFLHARESCLLRRFSETRRLHPLGFLPQAIGEEGALLAPLRAVAEKAVDTSDLTSRQLRNRIKDLFASTESLNVALTSFGFKHGALAGAELLFDARFLSNPYEIAELRELTGFDARVFDFVMNQDDAGALADLIEAYLRFQVPRTAAEGRAYLNVGIGCTGGQHRSVSLVRELGSRFERRPISSDRKVAMQYFHRDAGDPR
ncbi:MAG: RNase adapter RapZ [Nannocystaceae bacterium]